MRDLRELGLNDAGMPVETLPPTQQQLALVEQLAGIRLPADYTRFLRFSNGGHPLLNTFYVQVDVKGYREQWSMDNFFSISSDDSLTEDTDEVVWRYHHRWEGLPAALVPIADNGFGDEIYLDLTGEGNGQVVLMAHERPEWARGELPAANVLLPVAASFDEFIDSLSADPDLENL